VRRFFAAERLALQLRTLTLGDVFPAFANDGNSAGQLNDNEGILQHFTSQTTVNESLEALTGGTTPQPKARFTVAQLMAAFGEALQREEDAWKR
jgi:osmoprotectant transport system ATP-binding protein